MSVDFESGGRSAFNLSGKVVVVVGGGQMPGPRIGNGRATAVVAARHGAEVVVVDIDTTAAERTVEMIGVEGGRGYAVPADVSSEQDCRHIFDTAIERSGRVDGMVYSVAINPPFDREANSMTKENFYHGIDVNMLGCFHCNRYAAHAMARNGGDTAGSIVNVSSIASIKNGLGLNIGIMPYALGKCGLNQITELTAVQFAGDGIRANTLMLGPIDSTIGNHDAQALFGLDEKQVEEAYRRTVALKMGRASAWETGYAALYLLSDESRFMTGQQIRLDGGAALTR